MKQELTYGRLRELLRYEPETGLFYWLESRGRVRVGDRAGQLQNQKRHGDQPRWFIRIDGRLYRTSRLAFLYMTGSWPPFQVDHEDIDSTNDRWTNLRLATAAQNQANKRTGRNNTTGFKGVHLDKRHGVYYAQISVNRQRVNVGTFSTAAEAAAARAAMASKLHGEFVRHA